MGHQAGLLVRLLQAGEVLPRAIAIAVPLEATMAVPATGALTGEAMKEAAALEALAGEVKEEVAEEVTGKLKE